MSPRKLWKKSKPCMGIVRLWLRAKSIMVIKRVELLKGGLEGKIQCLRGWAGINAEEGKDLYRNTVVWDSVTIMRQVDRSSPVNLF